MLTGVSDFAIPKCINTCHQDPDIPMTQTPIDDFLSGLSPMAPIAATRPPLMDGPDFSQDFETCDVPTFSTSGTPISRCQYPDSLRISDTCLPKRTAQIMCRGFQSGLTRSPVHGNADIPTPDASISATCLH
jgi:hypothetical protein